ncbi:hypothetical protein MGYG_06910 [Nannizzia gypsea CBS 118893]|uniref:Uncharacterized protein n=1 Tax=Arthroderma gypseum (strain ATCC MYA-4604 / CBS 118893) TaxID=535722 RepID=E4V1J6_ARTGP|nr:hypothetical protein MGYG_06910 [Nannizzia gypsea CBS 118893]EFR03911.1 hypothetical protein MGYG_06910 [Nannizzia gypsea CBS 118893]
MRERYSPNLAMSASGTCLMHSTIAIHIGAGISEDLSSYSAALKWWQSQAVTALKYDKLYNLPFLVVSYLDGWWLEVVVGWEVLCIGVAGL